MFPDLVCLPDFQPGAGGAADTLALLVDLGKFLAELVRAQFSGGREIAQALLLAQRPAAKGFFPEGVQIGGEIPNARRGVWELLDVFQPARLVHRALVFQVTVKRDGVQGVIAALDVRHGGQNDFMAFQVEQGRAELAQQGLLLVGRPIGIQKDTAERGALGLFIVRG